MRRVWPFWLLLGGGLIGGLAFDDMPAAQLDRRGERYLLQVDLHAHTRFGDGVLSPPEVVLEARRRGLNAVAISEHNSVRAAQLGAAFSRWIGGPSVIVSEEVTSRQAHVIALGIDRTIAPNHDLAVVLDAIHQQGGLAIAAHPTERFWPALSPHIAKLDGAEVVHPLAYARDDGARYAQILAFYQRAEQQGHPLAAIGSSDFHLFALLGADRTYLLADSSAPHDILAAIAARRTAAFAPDGRAFGDPAVIAELKRQPAVAPPRHPYDSRHPLDALSRIAGLLGLLGLLSLRWRPRPAA